VHRYELRSRRCHSNAKMISARIPTILTLWHDTAEFLTCLATLIQTDETYS
jgi:hypothetical protein